MADKITTSQTLKVENLFVDGDTRTFNLKNPRANIAASDIASLNSFMQANNVLIGDKAGGTFGRITKATIVNQTKTDFDLNG